MGFITGMCSIGPVGIAIAFTSSVIAISFCLMIVLTIFNFINMQIRFIGSLYSKFIDETPMYHVYTRSILNNTCPELEELRTLQMQPKTPETIEKMVDLLDGIIQTLEMKETHGVKNSLVSQFKSLKRNAA